MFKSLRAEVPAKINLYLQVGKLQETGFHDLDTVYQSVSLVDKITFTKSDNLQLNITSKLNNNVALVPVDENNLVIKALKLLSQKAEFSPKINITVEKNIPVAAGMAGGSADAAATLVLANEYFNCGLNKEELREIAAEIGSDVPFCISGGTARGLGRGEIITPVLTNRKLHWVIAIAKESLSTKKVFQHFDEMKVETEGSQSPNDLLNWLVDKSKPLVAAPLYNNLQPVAINLLPSIRTTLRAGLDAGASKALLSGSGPTCLFTCRNEHEAMEVATEIMGRGICQSVRVATSPAGGVKLI